MKHVLPVIILLCLTIATTAQNSSKTASVQSPALGISELKYSILGEDFEAGLMPPSGWSLVQGPTAATWDTASYNPAQGSYNAHCLFDETLSGTQNEWLISPSIDLTGFTSVSVEFWFQFSQYWGIYPYDNYDLLLMVSTDDGLTFSDTLWTELSTDTSAWQSWDWVQTQVDLSSYIGQTQLKIAFVYSGFDGAEAALDNISINTVGGMDEQNALASLYPQPASEYIVLNLKSDAKVELYNVLGKVVHAFDGLAGTRSYILPYLPEGSYFIRVSTGNKAISRSILILH